MMKMTIKNISGVLAAMTLGSSVMVAPAQADEPEKSGITASVVQAPGLSRTSKITTPAHLDRSVAQQERNEASVFGDMVYINRKQTSKPSLKLTFLPGVRRAPAHGVALSFLGTSIKQEGLLRSNKSFKIDNGQYEIGNSFQDIEVPSNNILEIRF